MRSFTTIFRETRHGRQQEDHQEPAPQGPAGARGQRHARRGEHAHAQDRGVPQAKPNKAKKETKAKKTSALDAAAKVLGEQGKPMNCQEMIDAMAAKGYWTSPGGKTPSATLYSAILRELKTKKSEARFRKTERGKFELRAKS